MRVDDCKRRDASVWDREYRSGVWDYLATEPQSPRYSIIAAWCRLLKPGARILDLGCGEAILLDFLSSGAYSFYHGIDVSQEAIARARRRARRPWRQKLSCADMETFVPRERWFDIAIFNETLYCSGDPVRVLSRYEDLLADGGLLVVSFTDLEPEPWRTVEQAFKNRRIAAHRLRDEIRGKGWHLAVYKAAAGARKSMGPKRPDFFRAPQEQVEGPLPLRLSPERAALFEGRGRLDLLEVGCGRAQNRDYFHGRGHRYVGLDLDSRRADVIAAGEALPFAAERFDAVLTIATLQYSLRPDLFLREASRVLRAEGTLTGTVAFLEPWTWGSYLHLTPGGLIRLLQDAGFEIEFLWPGWSVGAAVHGSAFRPWTRLGEAMGKAQDALHRWWWRAGGSGASEPASDIFTRRLEYAASLNFHARVHRPRSGAGRRSRATARHLRGAP
ncbi:MAG TPA: class I SAM-dependent methyltransferase [Thermoanaerobaculia bacterium]|nr:class I SAM-dependent methyltransferase [Thermoanaerobaculia bacterium]